jgi:hypothetical protein
MLVVKSENIDSQNVKIYHEIYFKYRFKKSKKLLLTAGLI